MPSVCCKKTAIAYFIGPGIGKLAAIRSTPNGNIAKLSCQAFGGFDRVEFWSATCVRPAQVPKQLASKCLGTFLDGFDRVAPDLLRVIFFVQEFAPHISGGKCFRM